MAAHVKRAILLLATLVWLGPSPAAAESVCAPDGIQDSGSIYRICMPPAGGYNGSLVVWAHGFQDSTEPVHIPEDQLQFGDLSLPELINSLGFGFATNSYSKTGLAVRQGMDDIRDLIGIYAAIHGAPQRTYLIGASEGGLITALLIEQHPELFAGGGAACGPIGNFNYQINYFGDARALFAYFFPGLIPGDPFHPAQALIDNWDIYYEQVVRPSVFSPGQRDKLDQWVRTARLAFDPNDYLATVSLSTRDVLNYGVVNLNDAAATLGGFPFDNTTRLYKGSDNDLLLNLLVPRARADTAAIREMRASYTTNGRLEIPLITMHTLRDQQVPYVHEVIYAFKTLLSGSLGSKHVNIPIDRYEHCNFTTSEVLFAFGVLLRRTADLVELRGVATVLKGEERARFAALARTHGLPFRMEGERLEAITR